MTSKLQHILVVDDNEINLLISKKVLAQSGIQVDVARNGKEATEQAPNESYDLILMDIQMPVMDGYEATKIIRENGFNQAIFALTASVSEIDEADHKLTGFDDYIEKPFTAEVILGRYEKYLAGK